MGFIGSRSEQNVEEGFDVRTATFLASLFFDILLEICYAIDLKLLEKRIWELFDVVTVIGLADGYVESSSEKKSRLDPSYDVYGQFVVFHLLVVSIYEY